jgi:molybdenum cofactor cytidylyltransferase
LKLAAIVLAAGKSSRMGSNKLLLEVGGNRVLDHILSKLRPIPTIVVLGHRPEDIKGLAENQGAKTVLNPDYERGMTTSFKAGLRALPDDVEAVFMVLSDTFGFEPELLERMVVALTENKDALIVSPVYESKRGHPVLFRSAILKEFKQLGDDETMKTVVNRHESRHVYVESDKWATIDLDTPEDLEKIRKFWAC